MKDISPAMAFEVLKCIVGSLPEPLIDISRVQTKQPKCTSLITFVFIFKKLPILIQMLVKSVTEKVACGRLLTSGMSHPKAMLLGRIMLMLNKAIEV